jgi:glycosyltransferase involved in cell wall biosynthesis
MHSLLDQTIRPRVSAIVPAHNEAGRIGRVLAVLKNSKLIDEIVVVNDGSTDTTAAVVKTHNVIYIEHQKNEGKGEAMENGVAASLGEIIVFCDADIIGCETKDIDSIIKPVIEGKVAMCIGMRNRKIYLIRFLLPFIPLLGGERALTRSLWEKLPKYYKEDFRVEAGLNTWAKYYTQGFSFTIFRDVSQVKKEKKYGLLEGVKRRAKMYQDVVVAEIHARQAPIPKNGKNKSYVIENITRQSISLALGVGLMTFYNVPKQVLEKLAEFSRVSPWLQEGISLVGTTIGLVLIGIGVASIVINFVIVVITHKRILNILSFVDTRQNV